jgi:hypothetical protein
MHTFQYTIFFILFFLLISQPLIAQDKDPKPTNSEIIQTKPQLDISDDQTEKISNHELKDEENKHKAQKKETAQNEDKQIKNKNSKKEDYRAKKARIEANSHEENIKQSTENYLEDF